MKRTLYVSMVLVLFSILIVGAEAFGTISLYDDFSGPYLDSQKWLAREFVREVDPVAEKLVSKIGNEPGTGVFRNHTSFIDPASITAIECELTVVATNLDTGIDPWSFARIEGFFYNTQAVGGATGDILAGVFIGDRGSGLEAYWGVLEILDDDLTNWVERGSGTLIGPGTLIYGTPYIAKIEYDGDNGFTFTVDGVSDSFPGPARQRDAVTLFRGLTTGISSNGGSGTGYASALFDDVYVNNEASVYDDFSTAPLDQTKWQDLEFVREIADGELRLNVQQTFPVHAVIGLGHKPAYLEAKVLVQDESQVFNGGAWGIAAIGGFYYNESRGPGSGQGYNGFEGNVLAENSIRLDEFNNLTAGCSVWRVDTPDGFGPGTGLDYYPFTTQIDFDTEYTLSIEFTGSTFIFKCNGETHQYDITTATYPPSIGQARSFRSAIFGGQGGSDYMKANFDDVYTGYTAQATYDATGTWDFTETDVWDSCDPDVQPGSGTVTITQDGNDVTMVVDGGETITGTVSGAYYALSGEFLEEGETERTYISFTLDSSTSGSGNYNWTWTDGEGWCEGGGFFTFTKQQEPVLGVNPTELVFEAGDTSKTFDITNGGEGTLTWDITMDQAWITVDPTSGTTTTETDTITVTVDRTQIPGYPTPGEYTGTVTVDSNGGTQDVTIRATIPAVPVLGVDPTSLEFKSIEPDATEKYFDITNQGTGTLNWSIEPDQAWITVNPTSGATTTETDTITVTVDRTGLAPGRYTGVASVTSDDGNKDVSITMEVGIAIMGKVLDLSQVPFDGDGVEGIRVSIATPTDYTSIEDTSGLNGDYELENVPPGTDDVSILCEGGAGFVNTYTAFFKTGAEDIEENLYITPQEFYDVIDELFGVTQQAGKGVIAGIVLDLDLEGKAGAKVSTEPSYDVFYFDEDGNPDPTLEETSSNGLFIIFNIAVGDVEVTATMSPAFATTKARAYADSVTVAPVAEVAEAPVGDGGDGGCFVATATFGSPLESHVQTLRDFRDRYLLTNPMGRAFVSLYYKYSPPVADFITKHPVVRKIARIGLYPMLELSKCFMEEDPSK